MPTTASGLVYCPNQKATIDVERCAACPWRSGGNATCVAEKRAEARDWRALMRILVP